MIDIILKVKDVDEEIKTFKSTIVPKDNCEVKSTTIYHIEIFFDSILAFQPKNLNTINTEGYE